MYCNISQIPLYIQKTQNETSLSALLIFPRNLVKIKFELFEWTHTQITQVWVQKWDQQLRDLAKGMS